MPTRSPQSLKQLFDSKLVVTLEEIRTTLDGASRATAFRHLKQVAYRRSYNHNGRYYTGYDPKRFDRLGLWSHGQIHFSREGSIKPTVVRLVREAMAGWTHRELLDLLHVRVQLFLRRAVQEGQIARQRMLGFFVYVDVDANVAEAQLRRRSQQIAVPSHVGVQDVDDKLVIQVLLVLIRHPEAAAGDVVRRLRGHSPPISMQQVKAVFTRYDLGEKRGPSIS